MDYDKYIHDLTRDILADRNGYTLLVENSAVMHLPNTNDEGLEKYLTDLGVQFEKKFMHTYIIIKYPQNFKFTEEMAIDMAKQLWGLEPKKAV